MSDQANDFIMARFLTGPHANAMSRTTPARLH
jgi:hypothetical protein